MTISRFLEYALCRRDTLSDLERAVLRDIPVHPAKYQGGEIIVHQGAAPKRSCLLVKGMATREHRFNERAKITSALHVPGDFVDLHAFLLTEIDHDVVAQGECSVEFVDRDILEEISRENPHLIRLLWHHTLIDAKLHRVWIATRARLSAFERTGHMMCELHARLSVVGLVEDNAFHCPIDQRKLAGILGYSAVHMNRAVQKLRAHQLLEWSRGRVRLPDPDALASLVGFDPDYLELTPTHR
ncbi:Crp/Fnr family transcriptional regulator [Roseivivax marinus]|uniref:Crp/Fnr family transcriptional regulator n=1 Tax=Roseivivax marinus TaxID=1379903 RepID=W4HDI2_9RHOB|nr:Crp/Fnr family transcriptional regulator [Roseivivax marinus]ETW10789.1 Crp/Fnr family transcriptional regulator [Roseivivax marinus]